MPNERWDDFALSREFEHINDFMQATAALPNQIAKLTAVVEENSRRLDSHHKWIEAMDVRHQSEVKEVKNLCERIGEELRNDTRERSRNRLQLVIAIIGAAAIIAAAIITAPH
jgi:predicted transcriptional regulator